MNPEFRRNVLLELSLHRLIAMPALLLLVFAAADLTSDVKVVADYGLLLMMGLLVLWGSRLAADSVLGEVAARTWDGQRMLALGPWAMSAGKLAGSTVYVWYGAALCVPALFYGLDRPFPTLARILLFGLFVQATAVFVSLVFLRLRPQRMRFQVTQAQLVALATGGLYWSFLSTPNFNVNWYGVIIDYTAFSLVSGLIFLAWVWAGVYRLMRIELQFRSLPFSWAAFVLFAAVYAGGFATWIESSFRFDFSGVEGVTLIFGYMIAFLVATVLTWVAAFAEPKGFVRLRRWAMFLRAGDYRRVLEATPSWLPSGLVAIGSGVLLVAQLWSAPDARDLLGGLANLESLGAFVLAALLFLARDIGLMYLFTLDGRARRGHLTVLVYLTILYAILPLFLDALGLESWLPALVPHADGDPVAIVLPVFLQVGLVGGLLALRWRRIARTMDAAGDAAG